MTKEEFCMKKAIHEFMKDCNEFGRNEAANYIKKYLVEGGE